MVSATNLKKVSAALKIVSVGFGQLEVGRHLICGGNWAMAGATTAVLAAAATPAD